MYQLFWDTYFQVIQIPSRAVGHAVKRGAEWVSTRDTNCVGKAVAAGLMTGAMGGATAGLAGGPFAEITVPGGAIGGALGTGAVAGIGGLMTCSSGTGQGGGADNSGGGDNTQHGEERISERKMSPAEIAEAKTGQAYEQSDGATAFVKKLASGRYNVVVEGEGGIVTVMKNKTAGEIRQLARNYGWR